MFSSLQRDSLSTSLGIIEDLVHQTFPTILDDLPSESGSSKIFLQSKMTVVNYESTLLDEELTNAQKVYNELTRQSEEIRNAERELLKEYLKWKRYGDKRKYLLKKLATEVNIRLQIPELLIKGVGIWTEADQKLASTPFIIDSENNKSESSVDRDAYNKTPPKDEYSDNGGKSTVSTNLKPKRRDQKSIRNFSRSGYVPVVPKLNQPKTEKVNKLIQSASNMTNESNLRTKHNDHSITVQKEPKHFSKSCYKGKPMVKQRATPMRTSGECKKF